VHNSLSGTYDGCEEFSLLLQEVPRLFLLIGNDRKGCTCCAFHAPNYVFKDEILTVGIKALCKIPDLLAFQERAC